MIATESRMLNSCCFGWCSTPDGIDDRDGPRMQTDPMRRYRAQRLTASMIATGPGARRGQHVTQCSTPDGIDDRDGTRARSEHGLRPMCSTPDGIDDRDGLAKGADALSTEACSTPDGIDDRDGLGPGQRACQGHGCSTPDGIDDRDGPRQSASFRSHRSVLNA